MSSRKNPYAASLAAEAPAKAAAPRKPEKPRDQVLSRVAKRAQVVKPPVRFCMAPRYRFALPDPPADLKMLRGPLVSGVGAAVKTSKMELDAKKSVVHGSVDFGLRADLVLPEQYAHRKKGMELLAEDQIVLAAIQPRIGGEVGKDVGSGRRVNLPPKRAKGATAFPWMRRMSYDEYASESRADRKPATPGGASAVALKAQKLQAQLRKDRVLTFDLAKIPKEQIRHPDKAKRGLRAVKSVPVYPDMEDWNTDLISMQFDLMAPLESVPRFVGKRVRGAEAFGNAVSISLSDESNKKFVSCFAPDELSLDEVVSREEGDSRVGEEYHELLREYSIREVAAATEKAGAKSRASRKFVVRTEGEGRQEVVGLSGIPNAWLLAPRPATLTPLAHPALELEREPLTREFKRRRLEKVVDELAGK